jgi:hypothetical protein
VHPPLPLITHHGHCEDRTSIWLRPAPVWISEEAHRFSHGFKQGASIGHAIPLMALVIEGDNGDATGHQEKVAGGRVLCAGAVLCSAGAKANTARCSDELGEVVGYFDSKAIVSKGTRHPD